MKFEDFLCSQNLMRTTMERKREQALRDMYCSKMFLHEKDPAKVRNTILNDVGLMQELLMRVAFLYEEELEKVAEYKKDHLENIALRAYRNFDGQTIRQLHDEIGTLKERLKKYEK